MCVAAGVAVCVAAGVAVCVASGQYSKSESVRVMQRFAVCVAVCVAVRVAVLHQGNNQNPTVCVCCSVLPCVL